MDTRFRTCAVVGLVALMTSPARALGDPLTSIDGSGLLVDETLVVDETPIDEAALVRQEETLARIPDVRVTYDEAGIPKRIEGRAIGVYIGTEESRETDLQNFMEELGPAFLATGTETLVERSSFTDPVGGRTYRLSERIRGRPVVGGELLLRTHGATGEIRKVEGRFLPDRGLPLDPVLSAAKAISSAVKSLQLGLRMKEDSRHSDAEQPELVYLLQRDGRGHLAWRMVLNYVAPDGSPQQDEVFVDSQDGSLLRSYPTRTALLNRKVYTANKKSVYPGTLLFNEGGSSQSSDAHALAVYENAGHVYDFFDIVFDRDSYDNNGKTIHLTVHYGAPGTSDEQNAFHIKTTSGGIHYLAFGDNVPPGAPLGADLDVVGHEFAHGVWSETAQFQLSADNTENKAIDEGLSDIIAASLEAWISGTVDSSTWWNAEMAFPPTGNRSLSAPKTAGVVYKDHYREFDPRLPWERPGVKHENSTIAGLAFKLLVTGGPHPRAALDPTLPQHSVPGIGIVKARRIFYNAAIHLPYYAEFSDLRAGTVEWATLLYGTTEINPVNKAWDAVGVKQCAPPAVPSLSVYNELCYGIYQLSWPGVAGAVRYVLQSSKYSNDFADTWTTGTALYGDLNSCTQQVGVNTWYRLRACNLCGCSGWRVRGPLVPYSTCF